MFFRWNRLALVCTVGLCALATSQGLGRADDGPPSPNIVGTWTGTFQSSVNTDLGGQVSLLITGQDGSRFVAMFLAGLIPGDPCRGTISASGEISIVAGTTAAKGVIRGTLRGNSMLLHYVIQTSAGGVDRGSMILQGQDF